MVKHYVTVDGQRIEFEMHPYPVGDRCLVEAPGVALFDVDGPHALNDARDILRSVFAKEASQ